MLSESLGSPDFELQGELSGGRLCDECHGQYAVWRARVGLILRALCDPCAREIGGVGYVQPKGVSDWHPPEGAGIAESAEGTGPPTPSEDDHDFDNRRIHDPVDEQIDHSIRSEEDFPTRIREYLDVLRDAEIPLEDWDLADMVRCWYKIRGHAGRCEHGHDTVEYHRCKDERRCPRCNRAYRYKMSEEMTSLAAAFGSDFIMRFVFTVPAEHREIDVAELLAKVHRTLGSFFSGVDILGWWGIPHEFSSRRPSRRNPHVEVFMIPFGLRRTWLKEYRTSIEGDRLEIRRLQCRTCKHKWELLLEQARDAERCPSCRSKDLLRLRVVRIDGVEHYEKWMLSDQVVDELEEQIHALRAPTMILETSDFTKRYVETQVEGILQKIRGRKRLEDLRRIWREEFPDVDTEVNVHYSYVDLEKAQRHTIPYALRPPLTPENVVVYNAGVRRRDAYLVYEINEKTRETVEIPLEDVPTIFEYEYYDPRRHRVHRMGFLSNSVWRHYYRALTGMDPPDEDDGDALLVCEVCGGRILEVWHNHYGWYDWLKDVFLEKGITVHHLIGDDGQDFYAWVCRNLNVAPATEDREPINPPSSL